MIAVEIGLYVVVVVDKDADMAFEQFDGVGRFDVDDTAEVGRDMLYREIVGHQNLLRSFEGKVDMAPGFWI